MEKCLEYTSLHCHHQQVSTKFFFHYFSLPTNSFKTIKYTKFRLTLYATLKHRQYDVTTIKRRISVWKNMKIIVLNCFSTFFECVLNAIFFCCIFISVDTAGRIIITNYFVLYNECRTKESERIPIWQRQTSSFSFIYIILMKNWTFSYLQRIHVVDRILFWRLKLISWIFCVYFITEKWKPWK